MKSKYTMALLAMGMSVAAMAQESDDMYFNSKDRLVVNKANELAMARKYQEADNNAVRNNPVNPSDSYTGRSVNPEYTAQGKNGTAIVQSNPDYYLSGYQPKNVNSSLSSGNYAYNNSSYYGSGMVRPYNMMGMTGYGGMGYSGFGYPYGGMYSPYNSMMGMGYGMGYGVGYGTGYGMTYGMGSGYGMGGYGSGGYGMGYGMSMFSPYGMGMYGMNSFYNPYSYGSGYYGGYNSVVVVNEGQNVVRGRHSVRSSDQNNYVDNSRNNSAVTNNAGMVRGGQTGRTSSGQDYYNSGWRSNANNYPTRSGYDNGGNSNSGWGNTRTGNTGYSNQRSSFDSFGGGGSRGSSFGGGGGGSTGGGGGGGGGGHSRGRN